MDFWPAHCPWGDFGNGQDGGRPWVGGLRENLAVVAKGEAWWSWKVEERSYDDGGLVLTVFP